jgi:hypothetical protein
MGYPFGHKLPKNKNENVKFRAYISADVEIHLNKPKKGKYLPIDIEFVTLFKKEGDVLW